MKSYLNFILGATFLFICTSCKKENVSTNTRKTKNEIKYAKGFTLENYDGYSVLKVINPWPKANKNYTYILKKAEAKLPDSLKSYTSVMVPIKTIVVTSTTHIPSLEMLDEVESLVGFPHLDYISSEKVRQRIEGNKIKELGNNHQLNTEVLLELQPDVIIGYGIDNQNPTLDNLQKSGLKVLLNGDWNEESPLGKAEWIKFFGALYGKQKEANALFASVEKEYLNTMALAKQVHYKPTILAGDMFEDHWYLPKGTSWGCRILKDANSNYLWSETKGTGSLSLSFETVFEKAKDADIWITSGQFSSLKEMNTNNTHYAQFKAFKTNNVYTFSNKKGKTGGVLYYELAPNRPDVVLKDLVKILHPEVLPNYKPFFFEKLK